MITAQAERIHKTATSLRTSLMEVLARVDQLCDLVDQLPIAPDPARAVIAVSHATFLRLDRATYTVLWNDKSCFLGFTMAFRVLERLARRPNEYVPTDRLLEELWSATRTASTVRSTVCRLRSKLRDARMKDLADRIDGSNPRHYGLMLQRL
jgi:DNA-binding response OmpR family regulator